MALIGKAGMHYVLMITTRGPCFTLLSELQQILPAASPLTCLFPVSPLRDNVIYLRAAQDQSLASIKDLKQRPDDVVLSRAHSLQPRILLPNSSELKVIFKTIIFQLSAFLGHFFEQQKSLCMEIFSQLFYHVQLDN